MRQFRACLLRRRNSLAEADLVSHQFGLKVFMPLLYRYFHILLLSCLCGCAASTQNSPGTVAHSAITSRQIIGALPQPYAVGQQATIIVKRDAGVYGSGLGATFTVNGRDIAYFKPGQFYQFNVAPGEYLFGVRQTGGLGKLLADVDREIAVQALSGRTYILRLYIERGSGMHIQRSSL